MTSDQEITLKDGRRLAFVEYGDAAGEPTVYFPGSPGNRLNPFLDAWGHECGLRFLSVDRPGYGRSTAQPDRRLVDLGDEGFGLWLARRLPPGTLTKAMAKGAPDADKELLARDDVRDLLLSSTRSMGWRDGRPAAMEMQLHGRPWGFDLAEVTSPVQLWHGGADNRAPISAARFVADRLPDGRLTEIADAGHLLLFQYWRDIFTGLRESAQHPG
jgi:pimeloyl-ACP methyl ester carboxylesterase